MQSPLNYTAIIPSPLGCHLGIQLDGEKLLRLDFLVNKKSAAMTVARKNERVVRELEKYFQNPKHIFNLELEIVGTPFQRKVWKAMQQIPVGATRSYGELAAELKTGPRAVGNACRANPIPLIIPCHRIVGQNHLGGFAGDTSGKLLQIKKWLLEHEKTC